MHGGAGVLTVGSNANVKIAAGQSPVFVPTTVSPSSNNSSVHHRCDAVCLCVQEPGSSGMLARNVAPEDVADILQIPLSQAAASEGT